MFDVRAAGGNAQAPQGLQRIAQLLSLDVDQLRQQYIALFPRAQYHCRQANTAQEAHVVNKDAWREAIREVQRMRWHQPRKIDVGALLTALQSYFVCGISTSGVEQRFSKVDHSITEGQAHMSAGTEAMVTKLLTEHAKYHPNVWVGSSKDNLCEVLPLGASR